MQTIAEFATDVKVSPKTVRRWIEKKMLRAVRVGRVIRITDDAAKEFIEKYLR